MSREGVNNKNQKKKYRLVLILFIIGYLIFRSVPTFYASTFKTTLAELGTLDEKIEGEGIIIKNEKVYKADGEGKVTLDKKEGDRVGVGAKIGQLSLIGDKSILKSELDEVNKKIESLENLDENKDYIKEDIRKNEESVESIIKELQINLFEGNLDEVKPLKEELDLYSQKQQVLEGDNTLLSQSLINLKEKRKQLEKEISENATIYYSEMSGIVSYEIDGLEEVFSTNNLLNYTSKDYKKISPNEKKVEDGSDLEAGDPVYKIVDNLEWYMMVKVNDKKELKNLEEGNNVYVTINDIDKKVQGKIIKKDKSFLLLEFNSFFHDYYNKRYVNVNLIKNSHEGLKIPSKVVTNKEGIDGVYVKDISGIIRFRPVKILYDDGEYTVVDEGDNNSLIEIEGSNRSLKTITINDEILTNVSRVKEGQIIN